MIMAARDSAPVAVSHKDAMNSYGETACEVIRIPTVKILNDRGEYAATMGVLPPWWRSFLRRIPRFRRGDEAAKNLTGLAVAAVAKRLATPTNRIDFLSKFQDGKDDDGQPMGREELTTEALTQLIAGSDTISK
jgi:benzoate 4-monooxygenase